MPCRPRVCEVCSTQYTPRDLSQKRCPQCRALAQVQLEEPFRDYRPGHPLPKAETHFGAPLKQVVFDLETWGLDRGWGVTMVASAMVHGDGPTKFCTFDLTETSKWPDKRSDDSELGAAILKVITGCHVAYAHNGLNFDIPWLNSVALKFGMPPLQIKLIDPVQVARRKYRIGNNSLGAVADFLGLPEQKMPVSREVWRSALLDDDKASWAILRERCESDVRVLNEVASRVTRDVGMIDFQGSAFR